MGYCSNKRTARDDLQQASSDPDTVGRVSVWCAMTRTDANLEDALPPGGARSTPSVSCRGCTLLSSLCLQLCAIMMPSLTCICTYTYIHTHKNVYTWKVRTCQTMTMRFWTGLSSRNTRLLRLQLIVRETVPKCNPYKKCAGHKFEQS